MTPLLSHRVIFGMAATLLITKFYRPGLPPRLVHRSGLIERLNEGLKSGCILTLISAPAGFGKSTLASEWINGLDLPAAWLSLDPSDDEPARFFAYVFAALQTVDGKIGREAGVLGEPLPPVDSMMTSLLNDIEQMDRKCLLILDDFQVLQDRSIFKAFEILLTNRPKNVHLVLITREDPQLPLARLRANHLMVEIRAEDLRFSNDDTFFFVNTLMELALSERDVAILTERTEGWAVGLQLAAVALKTELLARGRPGASDVISRLSGSHRYILSYLTEEVLNRQPRDVQTFLLQTSILDRLNGELCNAVTGRLDSAALLENLLSANLFVIRLDDEQHWYRYHHLFADLLTNRLRVLYGEETNELHRRASLWFAQACDLAPIEEKAVLAREAIEHSMAAKEYPSTVQLIEVHIKVLMDQWYAKTINRWMLMLPPEWSARSYRINLAFARMHLMQGGFTLALPYINHLVSLFSEGGDSQIAPPDQYKADWLALNSTLSSAAGRLTEALTLAQQALEIVPANDPDTLGQVYLALAVAYQQLSDTPHAIEAYQKLIAIGRESNNTITELMGISALALMVIQRGQLRYGFELACQGALRAEQMGMLPPICAGIYGELGQIHFHWCNFDQAELYLNQAARLSEKGSFSDAGIFYSVARSRLSQVRGNWDLAEQEIQKAVDLMRNDAPVVVREEVIAQRVNVFLAHNNLAAAEQFLFQEIIPLQGKTSFPNLIEGEIIPYPQGMLYISFLRILVFRMQNRIQTSGLPLFGDLPEPIEYTNRLLTILLEWQYISLALETILLRAQLHDILGNSQAGLADISAALDLAEPEGYLSPFLMEGRFVAKALSLLLKGGQSGNARTQFIQRVLDTFLLLQPMGLTKQNDVVEMKQPLAEPITARELEVLHLMVEGFTYEEIARHLVVSINTVRTHVKSLYGKLNVNNRASAIATARQLAIL